MAARKGLWRLRPVDGVIACPTLRPDGSLLIEPGYDTATGLYHLPDPSLRLPEIPDRPTKDDAAKALQRLDALLAEFPFVEQVDRSVALSLLLSSVARGAFTMMPVHGFTAPAAGTGKSYLADIASVMVSGRWCPVISAGRTEEELEKRLGAALLAGHQMLNIDNMTTELAGAALCQMVERPSVRIRILGTSEMPECEFRGVPIANGNNLVIVGDMNRRIVLSKLDAKLENPEDRTFTFNPVRTVLDNRGQYVADAMTVVRAFLAEGQSNKLSPLLSYGGWSDMIRSPLVWLGWPDPVETMKAARAADPVLATLRQVITAWRDCFGEHGQTTAHVATQLAGFDPTTDAGAKLLALREAIVQFAADHGRIDATKLGYWLRNNAGRIAGGRRFVSVGTAHGGANLWATVT